MQQLLQEQQKYYERVERAAAFIREKIKARATDSPLTAIVLGSGLGDIANSVENPLVLSAEDIPGWPRSTAPGHAGRVLIGKFGGRPVIVLQGRVHCYEGYSMRVVTIPTRVMGMLGVRQFIATNAAGALSSNLNPKDIAVVTDHINFMGENPLVGPFEPKWNVRFPDMTYTYSPRLLNILDLAGNDAGVTLKHGVYMAFRGPSYETPAEVHMARAMGGDIVGMSTVPEVIVAHAMGMEVAVLSCISNKAAGLTGDLLTEEEVLNVMTQSAHSLNDVLLSLMRELNAIDQGR